MNAKQSSLKVKDKELKIQIHEIEDKVINEMHAKEEMNLEIGIE